MKILEVLIEYSVSSLNTPFSYVCDDDINVDVGYRVYVPFNHRNVVAYVIKVFQTNQSLQQINSQSEYELKPIYKVLDTTAIIDDELFALAKHMEHEYVSPLIGCLQTILPPSYKPRTSGMKVVKGRVLTKLFANDLNDIKLTKKQSSVYEQIKQNDGMFLKDLSVGIAKELIKKGAVIKKEISVNENYLNAYAAYQDVITLNDEQQSVFEEVTNSNDQIFLLQGVTGSGKTEVYLNIVDYYVKQNKTAIVLVPEISLTPMIIKRFKQRFENIAILHGSLSIVEKQTQYDKIKNGEVSVVIGARSAIFAPLKNIGVIILDEEQSTSYKQDKQPSYHARDIALFRAKYHSCKVLLGSATPSFESKARASKGVYHLLTLNKRANKHKLPHVDIINMREDVSDFSPLISYSLDYEIKRCLSKNEKIILLHNRRGYSPYVSCRKCGYIFKCPTCELSMSYHKNGDKFKCHYCNHEVSFDHTCPKCGENEFLFMGSGTQKIEEVISTYYPQAKVLRMDNDTTSKKNGHLKILEEFENGDFNILLGTQMVAKGLDFHDVTLVGVINADLTLAAADFRSSEFTFELLSQVAGRAGRGEKIGNVIIQSYNPENHAIQKASKHEFEAFYQKEMLFRNKMNYPPFSFLSSLTVLSERADQACILADKIYAYIKDVKEFELLGPALPYVFKENNKIRMKILVKSKKHDLIRDKFNEINSVFIKESKERNCSIVYDIDTYHLL